MQWMRSVNYSAAWSPATCRCETSPSARRSGGNRRTINRARPAALGLALLVAAGGITGGDGAGVPGDGPEVEWVYGYGGWETEEHPHAAIQASDGGFVIVGEATGYAGSRIFVVRTDERGT